MYATINPSVIEISLPKEMRGRMKVSKVHENYVYINLINYTGIVSDIKKKMVNLTDDVKWRAQKNPHGLHCSGLLHGEKGQLKMDRVKETEMCFTTLGVALRVIKLYYVVENNNFWLGELGGGGD